MTDSTITVSSKNASSYRSQIRTRLASPGSSSSSTAIGHSTSPFQSRMVEARPMSQEKIQLRKLNDQFLSYIERVRLFETYNHCLTVHSEHIKTAQERIQTKFDLLKQEFQEYQQEQFEKENKDIQSENHRTAHIELQVDDLKARKDFFQKEHEKHRNQIIELQKKSIDLQAETEQIRFDYENLTDDSNHYRRHLSYYQALKSSIADEVHRQRDLTHRMQMEVDDLKIQKQIAVQAHEADTQAIQIHHDNTLYDMTSNFRFDAHGRSVLSEMLNEIREEYKQKDQQMRDELHRKYLHTYNQHMRKNVEQNSIGVNREDFERRHLINELNSLNDNRVVLRQKLALLHEHSKQFEINIERELRRKRDIQDKYDEQIKQLRSSIQDYESLIRDSSMIRSQTLKDEVDKYRQLLEGSDQQVGLRQLIGMPHRIEPPPSINRPRTPPPPPPVTPPANHEIHVPANTHLLLQPVVLTRQNSTSEISFETAPISTNTTTQQYLTINSIPDPIVPTEYDTDNDRSQTIQCISGRSSRMISETEIMLTNVTIIDDDTLPPLPPKEYLNTTENIVEISIDTTFNQAAIDETLPFTPMSVAPQTDLELISDGLQSPIISTLEQREDHENLPVETEILPPSEKSPVGLNLVSPSTPMMPTIEEEKGSISPVPEPDPIVVEIPVTTLPETNPLAKLISNLLPNVNSNQTGQSSPPSMVPLSVMNNDAPPFIPGQHQNSMSSHHMPNNQSGNQWNTRGGGGGGGNRRGQSGGYQRTGGGGGGNWHSGGPGGHNKQRRGPK